MSESSSVLQKKRADERFGAVRAAFGFIVVGIGLKLALFPLHRWLPGAYANAPSAVTVFIAATATKVAVYILLRLVFTVFGVEFALDMPYREVFFTLGIIGILFASISAIDQPTAKRMLAYSTISHMGFVFLGLLSGVTQDQPLVSTEAYGAALFYMLVYVLTTLASFGIILLLSRQGFECEEISDLKVIYVVLGG